MHIYRIKYKHSTNYTKAGNKKQQRMAERYWKNHKCNNHTSPQLKQQLQVQLPAQPNIIEKYIIVNNNNSVL